MRSTLPLFAAALAAAAPALPAETVNVPGFRAVQLNGGGEVSVRPGPVQRVTLVEGSSQITRFRVDGNGQLRISVCEGRCPQRYRLRVEIQTPRVPDLAISGGGTIRTAGGFADDHLAAAVNGGGVIDARAVNAANVTAAVNGGGQILVRAQRHLQAAVNGGGAVRYLGNPAVSMAVRGGGTVQPGS
ncbi:GIN domain-containing protein [Sphingomonas lutea]|nr:DUF2807 domain-containing protein [Sphingomonas lutea]